jgi:hypothetical protein
MKRGHVDSQAKKVVLFLTAALIWILTGTAIAPARSPGLPEVPKAPGQGAPKTARPQVPKAVPVLTGISPKAAPPGGMGELVLTGRNFFQGMALTISGVEILRAKVESPVRAIATIHVSENTPEGRCDLNLQWWYTANGEISPSPQGTPEVGQIASSVSFMIDNSAPMMIVLGKYTLFPEEELSVRKSMYGSGKDMQQRAAANQPSKDQQQNIQKQADSMKEMEAKYKRGEITQAEYMAAAMKAASGMMAQLTPQQKAAMGQQMTTASQMGQTSKQMTELQKQEKQIELRLNQGSISVLDGNTTLATEKVSALKDISSLPPLPDKDSSQEFQMTFSDGKKYCFRMAHEDAEDEVARLKKRLGR